MELQSLSSPPRSDSSLARSWVGNFAWLLLCAAALGAPLAIGGTPVPVQLGVSALALAACLAQLYYLHKLGRPLEWAPLLGPAALALGFTAFQLVPLPRPLVELLSPHAVALRGDLSTGWLPLSLDVPATLIELAKGFGYVGLFLCSVQAARPPRRRNWMLALLALTGAAIAVYSLLQHVLQAETIYGFYRPKAMPGSGLHGTFVNGNHAASLFALSGLTALALGAVAVDARRLLWLLVAGVCAAALLISGSRMGAVGFGAGALALTTVLFVRRLGAVRGTLLAIGLGIGCSTAVLVGADGLRQRITSVWSGDFWQTQKVNGWKAGAKLTADYFFTGVGRGAFAAPAAGYRDHEQGVRLLYPENGFIQTMSEWGVVVTALILVLLALALMRLFHSFAKFDLRVIGAAVGVLAIALHELADFGLEFPGVAAPTAFACGVVVAEWRRRGGKGAQLGRVATLTAVASWMVVLGLGSWAMGHTGDKEAAKASSDFKQHRLNLAWLAQAGARHPADDRFELVAAQEALKRGDTAAMRHLNRALRLHPANAQAHRLAGWALARFSHPDQGALEYRTAFALGMARDYDELMAVLGAHAAEALPEEPATLISFALYAAQQQRSELASRAADRAYEILPVEATAGERIRVALALGDRQRVRAAVQTLLAEHPHPGPQSYVAAARALEVVSDQAAAADLFNQGLKRYRADAPLLFAATRFRLGHSDSAGARVALASANSHEFSLAQRRELLELEAQVADALLDPTAAAQARESLSVLRQDMSDISARTH